LWVYLICVDDDSIQITTSLTLLAIATTVIDLLAIYIMPDRSAYYAAKYETTGDFSDIRRGRRRREPENTGATQVCEPI
jgi:hypothetical protein